MMTTLNIIGNKGLGYGMVYSSIVPGTIGSGFIAVGTKLCEVAAWLVNSGNERLAFAAGLEVLKACPDLKESIDVAVKNGVPLRTAVAALAMTETDIKRVANDNSNSADDDKLESDVRQVADDKGNSSDSNSSADISSSDNDNDSSDNGGGLDLSFLGQSKVVTTTVTSDDVKIAAVES